MIVPIKDLYIGKIKFDFVFLDQYLLKNGKEDRRITNTPHYKLIKEYQSNSELNLKKTDYFKFAEAHLGYFGKFFGHRDINGILIRMRKFLELYEDIKNNGFTYKRGKIIVFSDVTDFARSDSFGRPHPPTITYEPKNYEIYEGHHRAAILAALGYKKIRVDTYSKFKVIYNGILKKIALLKQKTYTSSL